MKNIDLSVETKVLIADDDRVTRIALRQILEKEGCLVYEAGDGAQALALFKRFKPAVVIVDAIMPVMDGFTAAPCHPSGQIYQFLDFHRFQQVVRVDTRGRAEAFTGDWGKLVTGMNGLLEAVAEPVNELMSVLRRMAVNDITKKVEKDYEGVWDELKNAVNDVNKRLTHIHETVINVSNGDLHDLENY